VVCRNVQRCHSGQYYARFTLAQLFDAQAKPKFGNRQV
jgi:hypothetical protein